jgi:uncharacterized protein (TIRG00374 family)
VGPRVALKAPTSDRVRRPRRLPPAIAKRLHWPTAKRTLSGSIKLVLFLFVFIYFGLPAITNARHAFDRLYTVEPLYLLGGLALQMSALVAYAQLTRAALPRDAVSLPFVTRVQLTTKAVTNTVPGGSAAGSALGYRLLTLGGVRGTDAGFGLVASALVSAVVLNVLLWVSLFVSIPAAGFRPIYVTMALIGVLVIAAFGSIVFALMRGQQQAERVVRAVAHRVRFLKEDRLVALIRRLAERLREVLSDPTLVRHLAGWAALNWLLDAASLWVFMRAFGSTVRIDDLLVAFCIANVSAVIPVTPGGLGVLDATMVAMLALFGYGDAAGLGVPTYRLAQFWLPIPLGALSYISLRFGPWRIEKSRDLRRLRDEADETVRSGETVYDWAERYGRRGSAVSTRGIDGEPDREPESERGPQLE